MSLHHVPTGPSRRRLRNLLAFLLGAWIAVYIFAVVVPAARATTHGFASYYTAARLLLHEPESMDRVYDDNWFAAQIPRAGIRDVYDIFHVQPPTMSSMLLPLAPFPHRTARALWTGFSLILLAAGLVVFSRALRLPARWGLVALPFCLIYVPIAENLYFGQAYLLVFFLLCVLFWAVPRDKARLAGLALALAALVKSAALWLWPLLLLNRRWRIVAWALVVVACAVAATLPWIGVDPWLRYLSSLPRLFSMPQRYVTAYQTVTSLSGHLFVYDRQWNASPAIDLPALASALNLLILLVSLVLSLRWGTLTSAGQEEQALTLALFLSLVATSAPVAEGYHYVMVLPALLVALWWAWLSACDWPAWAALGLAVLLLAAPLPYRSPGLQDRWLALLAYPRVYGAFILWGWLGWALERLRKRSTTS